MNNIVSRHEAPVASGACYCSRWCGFGCTRAAFDRATADARELVDDLGEGWIPHVWENCGWNYSVSKGVVDVHPSRLGSAVRGEWEIVGYTCFIQTRPQFVGKGESARDAFREALSNMQAAFDALVAVVPDIQRALATPAPQPAPDAKEQP